jgi:rod shape-determining protein MreD
MTGVRAGAVILSALVLQASLFTEVRVAGVSIELLLVVTIAAGITGGPDRGAVIGFVAGLGMDLLLQTPFGLAALAYAATGYVSGLVNEAVVRSARTLSVLIALAAAVFAIAVFVVAGELAGESLLSTPDLWRIVLVEALGCAVLVLPCRWVMRWVWDASEKPRAALT